jgi:hypothetical protein
MILLPTILTIIFLVGTAVAVATMELGLSPEMRKFPCVSGRTRILLRIYGLVLFGRGAILLMSIVNGNPEVIAWPGVVVCLVMFGVHVSLLENMLHLSLTGGIWERIQDRQARILAARARPHGAALEALAQEGVQTQVAVAPTVGFEKLA